MGRLIANPFEVFPTGGAPAFDPSDISDYGLDWFANSLSGLYSDGATITTGTGWPDETGNWDVDNVSGTPTYEAAEVNGQDVVKYDSATSDRTRDLSTYTFGNKITIAYACNPSSSVSQQFLLRLNGGEIYILKRNDDDINIKVSNAVTDLLSGDFASTPAPGNWMNFIITADLSSGVGDLQVYINSTTAQASDSEPSADGTIIPAAYWHVPTDTSYPDILLGRFIIYDKIITSGERTSLMNYLNDLYIP